MEKKSKLSSKKLMIIIAAVFLVCVAALGLLAYSRNRVKQVASEEDYGYVNPDETKADPDAGITIDGVLDEKEYQDNNWLYMRNDNGNATVDIAMTSYYGEKGMYFVYDVTESTPIYVNLNRSSTFNSCVEMYLALSDVTSMDSSEIFEIDLLPTGDMVFKQRNGKGAFMDVATTSDKMAHLGATTKGGEINTEDCYGYCLEFYIPWDYLEFLGMDVKEIKTDYVFVNTAHITSYNYAGNAETDRYWYSFAQQLGGNGWGNVSLYYRFDKDGVIGTVPVELVQGDHYTMEGVDRVIPGVKTHVEITPEDGYAINSILVNGEEYIKKVSYNEDGSISLDIRGVKEGLKISASAEAVTEGNKTLSGTVKVHKVGGDSLKGVTASYVGPNGEKPITIDSKGNFKLTDLKQGFYTITVEKAGYEKIERGIYLNRNIDTELVLEYLMFEVESGRCWQLEYVNDGIINKMGGFGSLVTTDSYKNFSVEANFKYYEDVAESFDEQDRLEQRQGIRIKFGNDKYWHIDLLYQNEKYFIQYAKATTDSIFNFRDIYVLSEEEVEKFKSEDGIQLKVVREGNRAIIYLGGNLVAVEDLDKAYTNLTAKVGFESWGPYTDVRSMEYKITSDTGVDVKNIYFGYHKNWDVTKQFEGIVTQPNGGNTVWLRFYEKLANMDLTFRVKDNPKVDGEAPRTSIRFEFDNGETFIASICENDKGIVQIQKFPCTYTNNKWAGSYYNFTESEEAQYKTEEGIDFRVVRNGTEILFFIGGEYRTSVDLSEIIKGDTPAIVSIQHVDDKGVPYEMPFAISEKVEEVIITQEESAGKQHKTEKGTTVIVSAEEGYYIKAISLNGKDVSEGLSMDGTYVFTAEEENYTIKATLAKCIFETDYGWDLLEQNQGTIDGVTTGSVALPEGGTTSSNLNFIEKYADMDLTWRVKDHPDSDAASTTAPRTSFEFIFDEVLEGEKKTFTLSVSDSNKGVVQIQNTSGLKDKAYTSYYNFDEDETAKYRSADGVDVRIVRQGTDFILFVDEELKAVVDMSKYIKADTKATVKINHNDDNGVEIEMPYAVTDKVDIEKIYFGYHKGWDVTNQFEGSVMQPNGGNTVWLRFFDKIVTMDLSIKALDNPNVDGEAPSTNVRFQFDNDETFLVGIGVNSGDGTIHLWNQKSTTNEKAKSLYKFSAEEQAQYETEEGIDFRIVRNGTDILFFLGGEYKTCVDLVEFVEADTPSVVSIMHYGDVGVPYVMPFELSEELDLVTIKTEANDGKKLLTDKTSYVVGQEVNVEAEEGYYIKKIIVNSTDDSANLNLDGTYTFTATEKEYTLVATVKESVVRASDGWDILEQDTGIVSRPTGGKTDAWLDFYDKYTTMDLTLNLKDEPEIEGETRTTVRVKFNNEAKDVVYFSVVSQDNVLKFQTTPGTIHTKYTTHKSWAGAEKTLYESEDGIDFRIVRDGTKFIVYMQDGANPDLMNRIQEFDLSQYIEADTKATVSIQREGDASTEITIPFSVSDTLPKQVKITAKDQSDEELVTDWDKYFVGDIVVVSAKDGYYCKEMTVNDDAATLELDGTYSFVATEKEYNIEAVVAEKIFVTQTGWDLREQNGGTKDGVTTGKVAVSDGKIGGGDGWLYFDEKYTDIDLTITAKGDADVAGGDDARTSVGFTFGDKAIAISLTENNNGVVVQHYPGIKNTVYKNNWTAYKTYAQTDAVAKQYNSSEGLKLRLVRKGTDLVVYVEDIAHEGVMVEAVCIDLSEHGITAEDKATVGIRYEYTKNTKNTPIEIPFEFTTNVVPTTITTTMDNTSGTFAAQNDHNFVGDKVLIERTSSYNKEALQHLAGVKVDGETINLDADATCSFVATEEEHSVEAIYRDTIFIETTSSEWNLTQQNQGTDEKGVTRGIVSMRGDRQAWLRLYEANDVRYGDVDLTFTLKDLGGSGNSWSQIKLIFRNADGSDKVLLLTVQESSGKATLKRESHSSIPVSETICDLDYTKYTGEGVAIGVKREGTKVLIYLDDVFQKSLDLSAYIENDSLARIHYSHSGGSSEQVEIPYKLRFPNIVIEDSEYGTVIADKSFCDIGDKIVIQKGELFDSSYYLAGLLINNEEVSLNSNGTYTLTATESSYVIEGIYKKKIFNDTSLWDLSKQNQGTDAEGTTSGVITYTDAVGQANWLYLYRANTEGKDYGDIDLTLKIKDYGVGKSNSGKASTQVRFDFENNKWFRFVIQEDGAGGVYVHRTGDSSSTSDFAFSTEAAAAYYGDGITVRIKREGTNFLFYVGEEPAKTFDLSSITGKDTKAAVGIMRDHDIDVAVSIPYKLRVPIIRVEDSEYGTVVADKYSYSIGDTIVIEEDEFFDSSYYLAGLLINNEEVSMNSDGTYSLTATESSYVIKGIYRKRIFLDKTGWNLTQQNQGTVNGVTSGVISASGNINSWLYLYEEPGVARYGDIDLAFTFKDMGGSNNSSSQIKFIFKNADNTDKAILFITVRESGSKAALIQQLRGEAEQTICNLDYTKYTGEGVTVRVKREGTKVSLYVDDVFQKNLDLSAYINNESLARICIIQNGGSSEQVEIPYKLSFLESIVTLNESATSLFYINDKKTALADPFVLDNGDGNYYLYGTTASGKDLQAYKSTDLMTWTEVGSVLDASCKEVLQKDIWAPEVVKDGDTYYMFFSATPKADTNVTDGNATKQLMVATSKYPDKEFKLVDFTDVNSCGEGNTHTIDTSKYPHSYAKYLMLEPETYTAFAGGSSGYTGAIDPHPYVDGENKYLFWKIEKTPGSICVVQMDNWLKPNWDTKKVVLVADKAEEGQCVEAPEVIKHGDKYYLTYSMGTYVDNTYQVGVAFADSIMGPYTKLPAAEGGILLSSQNLGNSDITGAGHHSFVKVGEQLYIVYHRHDDPVAQGDARNHAIDEVKWIDNGTGLEVMYVNGPTSTYQPKIIGSAYTNIAGTATVSGTTDASYLTDGLLSVQKNGNATFINNIKETSIANTTTFTFEFNSVKEVGAIMTYNSKNDTTFFKNISRIEMIGEKDGQNVIYYMNNVKFNEAYYTDNKVIPGSAAYAVFNPLNIKSIKITVEVPAGQSSVGISEIKILGK